MRVLDPPILGCDRLSRCADRRWDRRLCVRRGVAVARRPYMTVMTVTAVGFRGSAPCPSLAGTLRWFFGVGGRHHGNRRLVRADRLIHRGIRRQLARSEGGLLKKAYL